MPHNPSLHNDITHVRHWTPLLWSASWSTDHARRKRRDPSPPVYVPPGDRPGVADPEPPRNPLRDNGLAWAVARLWHRWQPAVTGPSVFTPTWHVEALGRPIERAAQLRERQTPTPTSHVPPVTTCNNYALNVSSLQLPYSLRTAYSLEIQLSTINYYRPSTYESTPHYEPAAI